MAEFIAASALDEPDAFDPRIWRAARGGTPRDLETRSEAWRPWRAYAAMLLWQKGAVHARRRHAGRHDATKRVVP
jgi:AraC family transcriptional regulator of adaptative response / DNA-3-methyladenine glycosylase II